MNLFLLTLTIIPLLPADLLQLLKALIGCLAVANSDCRLSREEWEDPHVFPSLLVVSCQELPGHLGISCLSLFNIQGSITWLRPSCTLSG